MLPGAFPARSRFPMLPCAFPARSIFPLMPCGFPARSGFPMALCIGTSAGSCFPMLPQRLPLEHLPRSSFRTAATRGAVTSSAQTSASLHPPAALRLRVLPFTRDMGVHGLCGRVPDSAGSICLSDCCCSDIANLSAHLHRLLTPPPYLLLMRLSPGRGRRCCVQDEAAAWPGGRCCVQDEAVAWPGAAFLQITARTNPCSRHLWGTLARAVASICAHRAR